MPPCTWMFSAAANRYACEQQMCAVAAATPKFRRVLVREAGRLAGRRPAELTSA